jgi:MHS family proline/betaine transporter-like MFS transporter
VLASAFGILVTGWIGDRVPPRYLLRTGVVLLMMFALPFYAALEGRTANLTLVCILAGLCAGLTNGSFAVLLTDLFPTRIRFTGVALIFNVSFTLFSGMAPLAATTLIRETGRAVSPAYLMMGTALLALVGSLWVERFGGNVLRNAPAPRAEEAPPARAV